MNLAVIFVFLLLLISLYGYYLMIKKSKLEKEIRDNMLDYSCFRCKKVISIDDKKCPNCEFVTIFGNRKKKEWYLVIILIGWLFVAMKFFRQGLF